MFSEQEAGNGGEAVHGKMIKFPGLRPVEPEVTLDDV